MKPRLIQCWIILSSVAITLYYAVLGIIVALFGSAKRQRIDRYLRIWAQRLLAIIDLDYQVYNPYHVKFIAGKNYIVMCNHTSLYDIPLSTVAIEGSMRMVAKKELSYLPVFAYALKKSEFIFIDRHNRQQAAQTLQQAAAKMRDGIIIWLAPEGTRSLSGTLLPFKKGGFILAFETEAIIIPLGIRGAANIIAPKKININRHQHAEVHIGKPIEAALYTLSQRAQLMADVAAAIKVAANLS